MFVTDVDDQMCWWQVWRARHLHQISVTNIKFWRNMMLVSDQWWPMLVPRALLIDDIKSFLNLAPRWISSYEMGHQHHCHHFELFSIKYSESAKIPSLMVRTHDLQGLKILTVRPWTSKMNAFLTTYHYSLDRWWILNPEN